MSGSETISSNGVPARFKKQDVLDALGGFRQALKDLGAL